MRHIGATMLAIHGRASIQRRAQNLRTITVFRKDDMRPMMLRREAARNAVLLALYHLADDAGMLCHAPNKLIIEASGKNPGAVKIALRELEGEKAITQLGYREGLSHRVFVLMDHPDAKKFVRHIRDAYASLYGRPTRNPSASMRA
jgi:hypothetical protein